MSTDDFNPMKKYTNPIGEIGQVFEKLTTGMPDIPKTHPEEIAFPVPDWDAIREGKERMAGRLAAEEIYDHLMGQLEAFQKNLEPNEELGVQLANYGLPAEIHIRNVDYTNPNLIEFHGVSASGDKVQLIQHVSQLNFMLIAVKPVEETPYRIGF